LEAAEASEPSNLLSEAMPSVQSYWISPRGETIPSGTLHITAVVRNPEQFGYTGEELKEIEAKYGESLEQEGEARQEIMENLLRQQWIRLRYRPRQDTWVGETGRDARAVQHHLLRWMGEMVLDGQASDNTELRFTPLDTMATAVTSFGEMLRAA